MEPTTSFLGDSSAEDEQREKTRLLFEATLTAITQDMRKNSTFMSREKVNNRIELLRSAKAKGNRAKTTEEYNAIRRFSIANIDGQEQLVVKVKDADGKKSDRLQIVAAGEDIFDILYNLHSKQGHVGRNKMVTEVQKRYKNITRRICITFLESCEFCRDRQFNKKRSSQTIKFNSICRIHLIDMSWTKQDNGFRFIMVYEEEATKFIQLRALATDQPDDMATAVSDIFGVFGPTDVLMMENGDEELGRNVIANLSSIWPEFQIGLGKSLSDEINIKTECEPGEESVVVSLQNMISSAMIAGGCNDWTKYLHRVQLQRNQMIHPAIEKSPFQAVFGKPSAKLELNLENDSMGEELLEEEMIISKVKQEYEDQFD